MTAARTSEKIQLADRAIDVWPDDVEVLDWVEPNVKIAVFNDTEAYHPRLVERTLALETDPVLGKAFPGYAGSAKVYHLDRWNYPEAELIHRRAQELFKRVLNTPNAAVDLSWANIYREGDYCLPHSHVRATAGIVYFLELGLEPGADSASGGAGQGRFMFADPRFKVCCREEEHAMTTPGGPMARNGMMIMFPGKIVHMVDVFKHPGPRITLSWNLNEHFVPGSPFPEPAADNPQPS